MTDWQPIATFPRDGTIVQIREGGLAYTHAYWAASEIRHVEYAHSNRPTHWRYYKATG